MATCLCGCGQTTNVIPLNNFKKGMIKGTSYKYVHGHNCGSNFRGKKLSKERCQAMGLLKTGWHHSEETKRKMSRSRVGRKISEYNRMKLNEARIGSHHSDESKKKMRESHIGKKLSDEHKKKIGISNIGRNIGRKRSPKTIALMREIRSRVITPKRDTTIEVKIQKYLSSLDIEYTPHKYMKIPHAYQCDVFIPSLNLVIECDGNYWHNYPTGNDIDHTRTKELLENGFQILRLWESDIRKLSIEDFKKIIGEKMGELK